MTHTVLAWFLIPRPLRAWVRLRARVGSAHYISVCSEMEPAETLPSTSCSSTEAEFATQSAESDYSELNRLFRAKR